MINLENKIVCNIYIYVKQLESNTSTYNLTLKIGVSALSPYVPMVCFPC